MLRRASPSALLPQNEVFSVRSRESLGTSCSSQVGPAGGGLGGTKGKRSSSSVCRSHFFLAGSFLDADRTSGLSASSSSSSMYCAVLSWRGIQTKSWTCNFVSFWIQFNSRTQVFHLREGKQDGHITCLKHINFVRKWWKCWKVIDAAANTKDL